MNGIIFDIKRYAIHDGPGIRTTVFFKGCPLHCWWCHNPESQEMKPEQIEELHQTLYRGRNLPEGTGLVGWETSVGDLMNVIKKDIIFYDQSGGGVTFSGGEPLLQPDFLTSLLQACREEAIQTVVDTSGYAPWEVFRQIIPFTDIFFYDIKLMDEQEHLKFTGVSNQTILENLSRLLDEKQRTIIRIPLIPGVTDTPENLDQIAEFISTLKEIEGIHLLPYNPIGEIKYHRYHRTNRLGKLSIQQKEYLDTILCKFKTVHHNVKIGG
jgi:pyruvate formate lyase activating enzyme